MNTLHQNSMLCQSEQTKALHHTAPTKMLHHIVQTQLLHSAQTRLLSTKMTKPAFFAFAGKELIHPGVKPFTIELAANFALFAAITAGGNGKEASHFHKDDGHAHH